MPRLLESLQFMRIRRARLGLHGEALAAIVGLYLEDGIDARIGPSRGEVIYRKAGLLQPPRSFHKHKVNYKHGDDNFKILMISCRWCTDSIAVAVLRTMQPHSAVGNRARDDRAQLLARVKDNTIS